MENLYKFKEDYENIEVTELLDNSAEIYAGEVNLNRSIPDFRDGFKPVQRRILYGMSTLGLDPAKPHKKSARITGDVMGKYHPHGNLAIYLAMSGLAQWWNTNVMFVDGHGNYGSILGSDPAAERYTEARLSKAGELMVKDLKRDAVDMIPNFDGTEVEPRILPAPIPNALLNGTIGIGWSQATSIAPHNVNELLDSAIYLAETPKGEENLKDFMKIYKGADFPTGCDVIISKKELEKEVLTGQAKYTMRATMEYHAGGFRKDGIPQIHIKSMPYQTYVDPTIQKIAEVLVESKSFGVTDLQDYTKGQQVDIRIYFKKGTDEERLKRIGAHLLKNAGLQKNISVNNLMIRHGKPVELGVIEYLRDFNDFRLETLRRTWQFDLNKLQTRLERVKGLLRLEDITDDVIKIAKISTGKENFKTAIINKYEFTPLQAEHIASLQIYQLGRQNFEALKNELEEGLETESKLTSYLNDEAIAVAQLIEDLKTSKGFFKDSVRLSKVYDSAKVEELETLKVEEMIEATKTKVIVKRGLQMFQIGRTAYSNQIEKYKDDDIVAAIDAMSTDYVIAVTKSGTGVTRMIHDLQSTTLDGKVKMLNQEVPDLTADEEFVGAIVVDKNGKNQKFFTLTAEGLVKVGDATKLLPSVTNKGYMKRLIKVGKTKTGTDQFVKAMNITDKELESLEMHVTLKDESRKSGNVVRKVPLSKFKDRSDSGSSAGTTGVNTGKGKLPFIDVEFKEVVNED